MSIQDKIKEINILLDQEIKEVNRSRFLSLILGGIILAGLGSYLFWLNSISCRYVNERNFSNIVFDGFSRNIPNVMHIFQQSVIRALPKTMELLKNQANKEMISRRIQGNLFFRHAVGQAFVQADIMLQEEIRDKASPYRQHLARELEILSDHNKTPEELKGLEEVIEKSIFNEVNRVLELTLVQLQKIESQMKEAINKKEGTEEEKLIIYWVNFYEQNFKGDNIR